MLNLAPLVAALSTTPAPDAVATPRVPETRVIGGWGAASGKTHAGMGLSAMLTHRISVLELGFELNTSFLFSTMAGMGAVCGLHLGDNLSASVLGTAGMHHYSGVGTGLLSDDPGVKGSTPYVGGRLVVGYAFRVS